MGDETVLPLLAGRIEKESFSLSDKDCDPRAQIVVLRSRSRSERRSLIRYSESDPREGSWAQN